VLFFLREKCWWLVAGGWFVLREKYYWLVADKPNERGDYLEISKQRKVSPFWLGIWYIIRLLICTSKHHQRPTKPNIKLG
jgi:hypothetical protein